MECASSFGFQFLVLLTWLIVLCMLLWLVAIVFVVVGGVSALRIISILQVVVGLIGVATYRPLFACLCVLSGSCIAVV